MSLFNFQSLPTELQLQVMDFLPARSLMNLLESSKRMNSLALSSLNSEINDLTTENDSIFISIFSPQNKNCLIRTFNAICVSHSGSQLPTPTLAKTLQNSQVDMDQVSNKLSSLQPVENKPILFQTLYQQPQNSYNTIFQLGNLEYTRDPLKLGQTETHTPEKSTNLQLIVNEDEPFIKLQFEMQLMCKNRLKSIFKFNSRLRQLKDQGTVSGIITSKDNTVSVDYTLTKGEEIPPQSGYDYDIFYNYEIHFGKIEVKNSYLMACVENSISA